MINEVINEIVNAENKAKQITAAQEAEARSIALSTVSQAEQIKEQAAQKTKEAVKEIERQAQEQAAKLIKEIEKRADEQAAELIRQSERNVAKTVEYIAEMIIKGIEE